MTENIGKIAGIIWHYLHDNGPSSFNQIALKTKIKKNDLHRGIGWLLKEDKLSIELVKRSEIISLK